MKAKELEILFVIMSAVFVFFLVNNILLSCYNARNEKADDFRTGRVIYKENIQGRHSIDVRAYGRYLVTEEEYKKIKIGDKAPKRILESTKKKE